MFIYSIYTQAREEALSIWILNDLNAYSLDQNVIRFICKWSHSERLETFVFVLAIESTTAAATRKGILPFQMA